MPRDGSGTYNLTSGIPVTTETVISSTMFNTFTSDIATALTNSLSADGQTPVTANLPMSTFKHTNVGDATTRDQYASAGQVQDSALITLGSVSGTDTITGTLSPGGGSVTEGMLIVFEPQNNNTGAATLNVNSDGADAIVKFGGDALEADDLVANVPAIVVYSGTNWQLMNPQTLTPDSVSTGSITASDIAIGGGQTISDSDNVALYDANVNQFSSGTFLNARIAESNVTQHEAALSIAGSQLTGTVPDARLSSNVALLDQGNTFTADQFLFNNTILRSRTVGGSSRALVWMNANDTAMFGPGSEAVTVQGSSIELANGDVTIPDGSLAIGGGQAISDSDNIALVDTDNDFSENQRIRVDGKLAKLAIHREDSNQSDSSAIDLLEGGNSFGVSQAFGWRIKLDGDTNELLFQSGSQTTVNTRFKLERDTGNIYYGDREIGFREMLVNNIGGSTSVTTDADDSHAVIYKSSGGGGDTVTIDGNDYSVGAVISFVNNGGDAWTIAISDDTLHQAGTGSTGSRTLADHGMATAVKVDGSNWFISGTGLS